MQTSMRSCGHLLSRCRKKSPPIRSVLLIAILLNFQTVQAFWHCLYPDIFKPKFQQVPIYNQVQPQTSIFPSYVPPSIAYRPLKSILWPKWNFFGNKNIFGYNSVPLRPYSYQQASGDRLQNFNGYQITEPLNVAPIGIPPDINNLKSPPSSMSPNNWSAPLIYGSIIPQKSTTTTRRPNQSQVQPQQSPSQQQQQPTLKPADNRPNLFYDLSSLPASIPVPTIGPLIGQRSKNSTMVSTTTSTRRPKF